MHKYVFTSLMGFLLWGASAFPVTIIVHGSFAAHHNWYCPGGDFFDAVEKCAAINHDSVEFFRWSGGWSRRDIRRAGQALAKVIDYHYQRNEPITFVGHSNGASVIAAATNYMTMGVPMYDRFFADYRCPIQTVFTLAPMVDNHYFFPNMDVIGRIVNLFTMEDQALKTMEPLGVFNRVYPNYCRITNLLAWYHDEEDHTNKMFSHFDIHDPMIGSWLLCIPSIFAAFKVSNFENLFTQPAGHIVFYDNKLPTLEHMTPHEQKKLFKTKRKVPQFVANFCKEVILSHLSFLKRPFNRWFG